MRRPPQDRNQLLALRRRVSQRQSFTYTLLWEPKYGFGQNKRKTDSFYFLALVTQKLPLSVVYASWSGIGVFSIAFFAYFFYKQSVNWQTVLGLFFIIVGVTIVNIYKAEV